jgi:sugar phosphate isomerase/epimerase
VNGQLALECLPRTCLGNTADELLQIVSAVGNDLGVCFDSNHLLKEKPEEFVAKTGSRIVTVHLSDFDGVDERHWLPGTGIINWTEVVSELVKSGYQGPFMFEASKHKPESDGTVNPAKLTTPELYSSFEQIRENFLKTL